MLSVVKQELTPVETRFSSQELAKAVQEVQSGRVSEETDECTSCTGETPCTDCNENEVMTTKSTEMEDSGDYVFNINLPSGDNTAQQTEAADKRKRYIYIGLGLLAVFVLMFLAIKVMSKNKA